METLPNEVFRSVLKYLPPTDLARFTRLNKTYRSTINTHLREFSKPTLLLTIERNTIAECFRMVGQFTISTPNFRVSIVFPADGKRTVMHSNRLARNFMQPFYKLAQIHHDVPQRALFLEWLLQKVDLEALEMKYFDLFEELCGHVFEAIEKTKARCFRVLMKHSFKFINPYHPITWDFFPKLCEFQEKLGVRVELNINTDGGLSIISHLHHVDIINQYGKWFPKVICSFRSNWIFCSMHAICMRWLTGGLEAINFSLSFKYNERDKLASDVYMADLYSNKVLALDQQLVNITEDQLRSCYKYDYLPDEIIFENSKTGEILKFNISKVDNSAIVTVELETENFMQLE